jgi:hypothetical protein
LVALILTVGSNAVVAVAMKPPNFGSRGRWVRALPFITSSARRELRAKTTSYTRGTEERKGTDFKRVAVARRKRQT